MEDAEQLNSFLVDVFGRINKIEERAMAGGLGSAVSITEIHIIEKIGDREPVRMSEVARSIGVTLATLTVACDKLVAKGLVRRAQPPVMLWRKIWAAIMFCHRRSLCSARR